MENLQDIRRMLPILSSVGLSPDQLGPEKLEKLEKIFKDLGDPSQMTPHQARSILDEIGIEPPKNRLPMKGKTKIPRNSPCPCNSGKKYKKCCGGVQDRLKSSRKDTNDEETKS